MVKKALVICVSDYAYLPSLDFCKNDGKGVCEILQEIGFDIPDSNKLIGTVEYEKMRKAILDFFSDENIKPKDILLFYFSGHGLPESSGQSYLASSQIDPNKPFYYGYSFDELPKDLERCNSGKVVIILDCCYSGKADLETGMGKGSNGDDAAAILGKSNIDDKFKKHLGSGKFLLCACQGFQEARSTKKQDFSLFTYYVIEGLKGAGGRSVTKDGDVIPESLAKFVIEEFLNIPVPDRPKQRPIWKATDATGDLVLAAYPKLAEVEKVDDFASFYNNENLYATGKYPEALSHYNAILKDNSNDTNALFFKGQTLIQMKRFKEAMTCFQLILDLKADRKEKIRALHGKGVVYYRLGEIKKSNQTYEKVISLDENNHRSLYNRACNAAKEGDIKTTLHYLRKAVIVNPLLSYKIKNDEAFNQIRDSYDFMEFSGATIGSELR
jgi:caspase domain-containing protein/tetratricopeptide repeat protein